jgi:cell wall assembly regulator SMI1
MTDLDGTLRDLCNRLEAIAARHGDALALNPGLSEAAIANAEARLGSRLPAGYRAFLALHDGQASFKTGESRVPWMPGCPPLAPLARVLERWAELQELAADFPPPDATEDDDRIRSGVYRTSRIPIAGTPWWDGDTTFLDLDPGPAGCPGQLITMVTECDFVTLGTSFEAALARWVESLETGTWVCDPASGDVHPRGEAPHTAHPADRFAARQGG